MCVEEIHETDPARVIELYLRGQVLRRSSVGRLVQLGRTPREAEALVASAEKLCDGLFGTAETAVAPLAAAVTTEG
jgi:hypothetical protein